MTETQKNAMVKNYEMVELTVREYLALRNKGRINTAMAYQRTDKNHWNKPNIVDNFVRSILTGRPIGLFLATRDNGMYNMVDGKQRTRTLSSLYDGLLTPTDYDDNVNGNGVMDWQEREREQFLNTVIMMVVLSLDDSEVVEYFIDINRGGIPLTLLEAKRGEIVDKLLDLDSCVNHKVWDFMNDKANLKNNPFKSLVVESIVIQSIMSMNEESANLDYTSRKAIDWFIAHTLTKQDIANLKKKLDRLYWIVSVEFTEKSDIASVKRFSKKTHVEAILANLVGNEKKESCENMTLYLIEFFGQLRNARSDMRIFYGDSCSSATASNGQIVKRHEIIGKILSGNGDKPKPIVEKTKPKKQTNKSRNGEPEIIDADTMTEKMAKVESAKEESVNDFTPRGNVTGMIKTNELD